MLTVTASCVDCMGPICTVGKATVIVENLSLVCMANTQAQCLMQVRLLEKCIVVHAPVTHVAHVVGGQRMAGAGLCRLRYSSSITTGGMPRQACAIP